MISQHSINQVINSSDIIEVIESYIHLKKNGAIYKATCPFHKEKTPSFVVSPQKQIYHCFGCGAGGNAVKFVQEIENISFPEAIEKLASIKHIKLEYDGLNYQDKKIFEKKKDILNILDKLAKFYITILIKDDYVLEYLNKRAISRDMINKFQLGFSPSDFETINWLKNNNISFEDAESVGIIQKDQETNKLKVKFIKRLMFPIFDATGKIVAFGGRVLDNREPKYLNSPSTDFYIKGAILYGYNFSRSEIARTGIAIVVEGYVDVIALYQSGFKNVVAPLGTALTETQINILGKSSGKIHLVFDGDSAGFNATRRSIESIAKSEIKAIVTILPNGIDPADLVKNGEIEKLKNILSVNNSKDAIEWFIRDLINNFDLNDPYAKREAQQNISNFLATLKDFVRNKYELFAKELLGEGFRTNILAPKNINKHDLRNVIEITGLGEQALLKYILENRNNEEIYNKFINELEISDFINYGDDYKNIIENKNKDDDFDNFRKILLSQTPNYSEIDAELELINIKIKRSESEILKIKNSQISFSAKVEQMRNLKYNIIALEKRKIKLIKN